MHYRYTPYFDIITCTCIHTTQQYRKQKKIILFAFPGISGKCNFFFLLMCAHVTLLLITVMSPVASLQNMHYYTATSIHTRVITPIPPFIKRKMKLKRKSILFMDREKTLSQTHIQTRVWEHRCNYTKFAQTDLQMCSQRTCIAQSHQLYSMRNGEEK